MEEAISVLRDVYSGYLRHLGEENVNTLMAATNYGNTLVEMQRFKEARKLMRKTMPVARRILGDNADVTLKIRSIYARTLYKAHGVTLNDLREAVMTLDDAGRTARRVFGGAHPLTEAIDDSLQEARAALRARETL